ncbi:MAG: hypothetical protein PHH38_08020, partial [Candidatus Cloacimonetes bacterium]|nr:hypothetical protein [Candidatus Cloacimonadota bacterium]
MAAKRHKNDTSTFRELDYTGQIKSLSGQINVLVKAINANLEKAYEEGKNVTDRKLSIIMQLNRAINRIK